MTKLSRLAMAVAGAAALCGVAGAQDFSARADGAANRDLMGRSEVEGSGMAVRFTMPFGETAVRRNSAPELSLQMFNGEGGALRKLDVLSFSFSGEETKMRSAFAPMGFQAEGGGFFANPMNWVWIGLGAVGVYLIAEELDDEDEPAAPTTGCPGNAPAC